MDATIVYKKGGKYKDLKGSYSCRGVKTENELKAALADGWFKSVDEVFAPPKKKRAPKNVVD